MTLTGNTNPQLIMAGELFLNLSEKAQKDVINYLIALLASEQQEFASRKKDHEKE